jgi:hypothetical protein
MLYQLLFARHKNEVADKLLKTISNIYLNE